MLNKTQGAKTNIKEARKLASLTQKAAAEFLEVPLSTWENWEGGKNNPPEWAEKLIVEKLLNYKEDIKMKKLQGIINKELTLLEIDNNITEAGFTSLFENFETVLENMEGDTIYWSTEFNDDNDFTTVEIEVMQPEVIAKAGISEIMKCNAKIVAVSKN